MRTARQIKWVVAVLALTFLAGTLSDSYADTVRVKAQYDTPVSMRFFNKDGAPTDLNNILASYPPSESDTRHYRYPISTDPTSTITAAAGVAVPIYVGMFATNPLTVHSYIPNSDVPGSVTWVIVDNTGPDTTKITPSADGFSAEFRSTVAHRTHVVRAAYTIDGVTVQQELRVLVVPGAIAAVYIEPEAQALNPSSMNKPLTFTGNAPENDTLYMTSSETSRQVYALLRDKWGNYIAPSGGYYTYWSTYMLTEPDIKYTVWGPSGDELAVTAEHGDIPSVGQGLVVKTEDASGNHYITAKEETFPITTGVNPYRLPVKVLASSSSYKLTIVISPSGSGTVGRAPTGTGISGVYEYTPGTSVALTATPAPGYRFLSWSGGATGTASPATVVMNKDTTVTANFGLIPTYTLTVGRNPTFGGNVSVKVGTGAAENNPTVAKTVESGTSITVAATALAGYEFENWTAGTGGALPTGAGFSADRASNTFTMTTNVNMVANFKDITTPKPNCYALNIAEALNGTIEVTNTTKEKDGNCYPEGAVVTVKATPAAGYKFVSWGSALNGTTANPGTITINAAKTVSATFVLDEGQVVTMYTLTITQPANGGTISVYPPQSSYVAGTQVTLTATALSGYTFDGWSDGSKANPYTITITSNTALTANFTKQNPPDSTNPGANPKDGDKYAELLRFADTLISRIVAGPNVLKRVNGVGSMSFYISGGEVKSGQLRIYDVLGNSIAKIDVADRAGGNLGKRRAGSWDLTDSKGRPVPAGSYLIRGVLTRTDGGKARVSIIVNVNN